MPVRYKWIVWMIKDALWVVWNQKNKDKDELNEFYK